MNTMAENRTAEPLTQYVQRAITRVRAFDRRRPLPWDLLVTGFYVTAALIDFTSGGWKTITENASLPDWLILSLSLGFSVPLLWRRTHPVAVLAVMVPVAVVNSATGAMLQASLILLVALFNAALRVPMRTLLWLYGMVLVPFVVAAFRYPAEQGPEQNLVPAAMSLALSAVIGIAVRTRKDYLDSLVERARQLEVERDQQARLATAAERARIAREMHDIIGHNLSVITGLADGGRYAAAKSPERAAQALTAIATTSRQALTELRRLLDVLSEEEPTTEPDLTPQPGLTDLTRLIEGVRTAGLPVHTTIKGTPTITPGRQLTIYRVIQEALTNTLKHGGPNATSHIEMSYDEGGAVTVTVTDTGRGGDLNGTAGRGLPGMRERTALYGGTLEAGPRPTPEQGWRVHLHLPEEPPQ
ncbi:sensor histidine kinase [Streptomyces sp. TRM68416]|uniref:sensor histidine kinase n=1 Tax=Streptomyces sp. TRM68416 TaxID=2758412 RepID=UPI0016618A90|nr:histidine kinase [Streptomyces sp. TRM68416]MBD0840472.1 sensor histidine kinase [Streptomyces sp. TRM68416]